MHVTFTKMPGRRYLMTIVRERGPELAPRQGPGYDDYLPHDAVHFFVEAEAQLSGGVFGRIAAGRSNIFWPADPVVRQRQARREKKLKPGKDEQATWPAPRLLPPSASHYGSSGPVTVPSCPSGFPKRSRALWYRHW